jgi:hypothetical protein
MTTKNPRDHCESDQVSICKNFLFIKYPSIPTIPLIPCSTCRDSLECTANMESLANGDKQFLEIF